uniref:CPBP family intramembrane metalloprotease n=1 Tax=Gracilinema caldarium TaxID=215591 RepID=A0A7C3E5H1_9SPIR
MVLLIITRVISDSAFFFARPIYHNLQHLDPDGSYLYITLHHIIQAIFALLVIGLFSQVFHISSKEFGFNTNKFSFAIQRVIQFSLFWFCIQGFIGFLLVYMKKVSAAFPFPLTANNIIPYVAFQLVLSGTSEELLFRAMVMTPIIIYGKRRGFSERTSGLLAAGIATIIFMLAHINFTWNPFRITYFNFLQQLTCLIFGLFYSYLFIKTRSVIGSILAHNLLNTVIVAIGLILNWIFRHISL